MDGDGAALTALGVTQFPEGVDFCKMSDKSSGVLSEWLKASRTLYKHTYENAASWAYLQPASLTMPRGSAFLPHLTGRPNARLTEQYLEKIAQGAFSQKIKFGHSTISTYPKIDVSHPLPWLVLRYGSVEIGNATLPLAAVMARRNEPALSNLPAWAKWGAALEELEHAFPEVQPSKAEICDLWLAAIAAFATPAALGDDALSPLWRAASNDDVIPEALPSSQRLVPLGEVFISSSPNLARRARTPDRIVITLDEPTLNRWVDRGARNLSKFLEPQWEEPISPAQLLTAAVPELSDVLRPEVSETARCQPVSDLRLKLGDRAEPVPVPCLMWQGSLFLDMEQLEGCSRAERLRLLLNEIASAGWLTRTPEEALQYLGDARVDALRASVAQGATLAERLLRAAGKRREPLLEALGALKDLAFIRQCAPLRLAELTLAQLGPVTLTSIKDTLSAEGLNPPARWNTSEARSFVASIGFPAEFASAPETKREAEEFDQWSDRSTAPS